MKFVFVLFKIRNFVVVSCYVYLIHFAHSYMYKQKKAKMGVECRKSNPYIPCGKQVVKVIV